jgi:lauroyl/myristoyl acyltransferase
MLTMAAREIISTPLNFTLARLSANVFVNVLLLPVYLISYLLCLVISLSPVFPARTARENFKNRMHLGKSAQILATSAILFHYVLIFVEDFILWPAGLIVLKGQTQACDEVMSASLRAKEKSAGLAVLSAHFGNIEITAQYLTALLAGHISNENKLIALAKPSRSPALTNLMGWYRGLRKIEVLWTNRKDFIRVMMQSLKGGRAVALLIDQKPASQGFFTEFCGAKSAFPDGGVEIALRSGADFVCATSRRLFPGVYTFEGCSIDIQENSDRNSKNIINFYARWLETVIGRSPLQWCWDYRKWSRNPPEEQTT